MKAFESLKGMLCDPDGIVCIQGTNADRAKMQRHLNDAGKMVDMNNSLIVDNNYLRAKVKELEASLISQKAYYEGVFQDGAKRIEAEQAKVKVLTDALENCLVVSDWTALHLHVRQALSSTKGK